ncbi:MAG: hypothetical protein QOF51_1811 [Chloroflexota bacterium]|jgi:hypothetical protein|nr:hypothetical protein [Chloroflexota bacterium]
MQIEDVIVEIERIVRVGLTVLFTYLVALWIAAAWWTFQDIRSRTTDLLLQVTATVLVIVFNFPGLLIYLLLRPQRTLAELYDESLEEEALLRTMNEGALCPACGQGIEADFLFCPSCQARVRQLCQRCERPLLLRWSMCPYCGTSAAASPVPQQMVRPQAVPRVVIEPELRTIEGSISLDAPIPLRQTNVAP